MSDENQSVKTVSDAQPVEGTVSDGSQTPKAGWTSIQVYAMSVLCLLVGVTVGYLFRGSTAPQAASAPSAVPQAQMPGAAPQMGAGANGMAPGGAPPSPEQLKQMADKKVAPMLEELTKNPKDTDTMIKIGTLYLAARQFDDSEKFFQKAVDVKATPDSLTKLANAQFLSGKGDKAMDSLNKALKLDPKFANALYNLGMMKWQVNGDVKGAIDSWERLVKTNPNHPQIEQVKKMIARAKEHEKIPLGTKTDKPAM
jgi:cytochrome c-type biogenesis protein CcmH/NrfG